MRLDAHAPAVLDGDRRNKYFPNLLRLVPSHFPTLKLLRDSSLVSERREGRLRIYKLEPKPLEEVSEWIGHFEQFWIERLGALGTYLKKKQREKK